MVSTKVGFKLSTTSIQKYYGSNIAYVLGSDIYSFLGVDFIITDSYNPNKSDLKTIQKGKSQANTLDNILEAIGQVNYNETQNNPDKIEEYGGNCQAYTLLLDAYCKDNNIESKIFYSTNHMYNRVKIDNVWYKLDLTKGIMEIL